MIGLLKTIPLWAKLLGGGAIGYAAYKEVKKSKVPPPLPELPPAESQSNELPPFPPDPGYNDDPGYDEGGGSGGGSSGGGSGGGGPSPYPPPATTLPGIVPPDIGPVVPVVATPVSMVDVSPRLTRSAFGTTTPVATTPATPPRVDIVTPTADGGVRTVPRASFTINRATGATTVNEIKPNGAVVPLPTVAIRPSPVVPTTPVASITDALNAAKLQTSMNAANLARGMNIAARFTGLPLQPPAIPPPPPLVKPAPTIPTIPLNRPAPLGGRLPVPPPKPPAPAPVRPPPAPVATTMGVRLNTGVRLR